MSVFNKNCSHFVKHWYYGKKIKTPLGNTYLHILTNFQINRTFLASVVKKVTYTLLSPTGWTVDFDVEYFQNKMSSSRWYFCQMFSNLSPLSLPIFRQLCPKEKKWWGSLWLMCRSSKFYHFLPFCQKLEFGEKIEKSLSFRVGWS